MDDPCDWLLASRCCEVGGPICLLRGKADSELASPMDSVVAMAMMDFVVFMILVVLLWLVRPFGLAIGSPFVGAERTATSFSKPAQTETLGNLSDFFGPPEQAGFSTGRRSGL